MNTVTKMRNRHLESQAARFDDAMDHLETTAKSHPVAIRAILSNWDAFTDALYPSAYLPVKYREAAYASAPLHSQDLPEILNFVADFVSHEMYDDGLPRIIWGTYERPGSLRDIGNMTDPKARLKALRDYAARTPEFRIVECGTVGAVPYIFNLNHTSDYDLPGEILSCSLLESTLIPEGNQTEVSKMLKELCEQLING